MSNVFVLLSFPAGHPIPSSINQASLLPPPSVSGSQRFSNRRIFVISHISGKMHGYNNEIFNSIQHLLRVYSKPSTESELNR